MSAKRKYLFITGLLLSIFVIATVFAQADKTSERKQVALVEIKEAITPVTVKYIKRVLLVAKEKGYDTIIFTLDTPGGLVESTHLIVQDLMQADDNIDTVVYVSPSGSRAGSAGVFITMAARYAVMAPSCNIGAAHPVTMGPQGGGEKQNNENAKHLAQKIENDTVAFIKGIAVKRGRNVNWAIKAVRKSVSITSDEALRLNVIDYIADDIDEVITKIYGAKTAYTLHNLEKSRGEKLLSVLANPNLAYLFFILGLLGIGVEIRTPGLIFPGALGALFFILGLFATQVLPINYAGLFLMILAIVLFILEISIVSYGLLSVGGVIALILGSAMLFDSPLPYMRVSPWLIGALALSVVSLMGLAVWFIVPSLKNKVVSGREGMLDNVGVALAGFKEGRGQVKVHGEIWTACSEDTIAKGDGIKVISSQGLQLTVIKEK